MARAAEIGMTHMAITDHGTLSGHREFQRAAKESGIVPILGVEAYISPTDRFDRRTKANRQDGTNIYNHVILLAQNATGLENVNKLSERAWTEGFYHKPRIDMDILGEHSEGVIALSGCLGGLLSRAITNEQPEEAERYARQFKDILGDRFFIEVQSHNPLEVNAGLMDIARKLDIRPVVTSDCHYAREEDLWLENAMLILATSPKPNPEADLSKAAKMDFLDRYNYLYPDRMMNFEEYGIFLKSAQQHREGLAKHGIGDDAISNTMLIANMVGEYPYHSGLDLLPKLDNGLDPAEELEKMAWDGLAKRGLDHLPEYRERLREELDIIKPRFPMYFIIEADFVQWAIDQGIMIGPGRGSGAGSLLNYALRITNIDPIKHHLLFFRFINPERGDYPDVDTDVEINRRGDVKDYIIRKYGNVASIATFGKWQGKKAVRDAARVFRVPLAEVNAALKGADWLKDWWETWEPTERAREFTKKYPEVVDMAKFMFERINSSGIHAGGLIISSEPIEKYAPMQTGLQKGDPSKARIPVVAVDMEEAADIGFIKYDILGVKALTTIADTIKSVKTRLGIDIDLENIDMEEKEIYEEISAGHTVGLFQAEASAYTSLLFKMGGVANFDELVASNALVRPGAADSSAGAAFVARKKGEEQISFHHPIMQPFTKNTYGTCIYQEQVMLTMTELAGMSMGTADKVRKIIGKKKDVHELDPYRDEFIQGASKHITPKAAGGLWKDFEAHANYSFNASHAVAYSTVTYWTAWLKYHYPLDFMMSLLKNEKDTDTMVDYLIEAKRMGIKILLPHVNASGPDFQIEESNGVQAIRYGLNNIKYISSKVSAKIIAARPFKSYAHLTEVATAKYSGINARVIASLNAVGAAAFEDNPRTGNERNNFFEYLSIPAFENKRLPMIVKAQLTPLDEFVPNETFTCTGMVRSIKTGPNWARANIVDETASIDVFLPFENDVQKGKMYVFLVANGSIAKYISVDDLMEDNDSQFKDFLEAIKFDDIPAGKYRVVAFNPRRTKKGEMMGSVTVCDNDKEMETALVWPSQFPMAYTKCKEGALVSMTFKELEDGGFAINTIN